MLTAMTGGLELTLLYLAAALAGVAAFRLLRLPPMLGYLAVGVLIGPHALALAGEAGVLQRLAEFGVVFLMFTLGLEFSFAQLKAMKRDVLGLGSAQVGVSIALVVAFGLAIRPLYALPWQAWFILGAAFAMTSSAVIVKLLADRLELDSPHGRKAVALSLFQDVAVVPLLILVPALSRPMDELGGALGLALVKGLAVLAAIMWLGPKLLRPWFHFVAKRNSDELFVLNVLFVALGMAWLTEHAGLSLALGAFLAGMLISETTYRTQVEADIRPFRDILLGLFFITIGMLLNWRILLANWWAVLLLTALPMLVKALLIALLARLLGASGNLALRTGLWTCVSGEFGFVLLNLADSAQLVPPQLLNPVLASMVLSMLLMPFLAQRIDAIVMRFSASDWLQQSLALTSVARKTIATEQHVLILGYGRVGQNLARMLEAEKVPYTALDTDPDRVREAQLAGEQVSFGDASRAAALTAAGIHRARVVVITFLGTAMALRVLGTIRKLAPSVPVVVRTQDDLALEKLRAAGADEVVPESIEGSLMIASHALALAGVPLRRVLRNVQTARARRYELLRAYFHGATDEIEEEQAHDRLHSVTLPQGSPWAERTIGDLQLDELYVSVSVLRRGAKRLIEPPDSTPLDAGDTLVLCGKPDGLARAEERLLGSAARA
jgi:CPA2 family monovalent cation:H+ antiporter-2